MSIFNQVIDQPWAMLPGVLEILIQPVRSELNPLCFAKKPVQPVGNTLFTEKQKAISILSISGVIFPSENILSQLLGATTLDKLTYDFQHALENSAISEIILHIDSPGGVVTGVHECADRIYHARGKKPITAYVSGVAASAAYWLASAADEMVLEI